MPPKELVISVDSRFKSLLPMFLERQRDNIATLRSAYLTFNYAEIERLGHMMKGSCGGYGFFALGELAAAVEEASLARDRRVLNEQISLMEEHLSRVTIEFKDK